ncbi:YheC/YheD family endospore coat-associated protein [Paenibacillus gansuensis]|uniref:YheC/YheD family protein n=1 Tax=Paenibacillus gansuensis TaxID=306542 RepID=A0ABW5PER9_9BACL
MPQPVLGIMTLYLNDRKHIEERAIFQRMIASGKELGLACFVFTPEDVDASRKLIKAQFYDPNSGRWTRKWTQFPTMIFDRCRYQPNKRFKQLQRFRRNYPKLLYLNRPIANKWMMHQLFTENPRIKPHLPETRLCMKVSDVTDFLKRYNLVYLKPKNGTGGRGILRIEKVTAGQYLIQGRDHSRRIIKPQRVTPGQIAMRLGSWGLAGNYLIQQGIQLKLQDGRVHDYRLLIQKNRQGQWEVTGCAGRIGAYRSITSNLHGGGRAVKMNELLKQWFDSDDQIESVKKTADQLALETASFVEEKYGRLCELALDIAIDKSGHVWMLEINPKPAREVFRRIGEQDTYTKAISRPLEYALWLYKQRKPAGTSGSNSKRK